MQIVIDIDKNLYTRLFDNGVDNYDDVADMAKAIRKGTPLPKGHGDLVDFDKLCREYWDGNYMEIHRNDLQSIKPIIEADEAESEDKNE